MAEVGCHRIVNTADKRIGKCACNTVNRLVAAGCQKRDYHDNRRDDNECFAPARQSRPAASALRSIRRHRSTLSARKLCLRFLRKAVCSRCLPRACICAAWAFVTKYAITVILYTIRFLCFGFAGLTAVCLVFVILKIIQNRYLLCYCNLFAVTSITQHPPKKNRKISADYILQKVLTVYYVSWYT